MDLLIAYWTASFIGNALNQGWFNRCPHSSRRLCVYGTDYRRSGQMTGKLTARGTRAASSLGAALPFDLKARLGGHVGPMSAWYSQVSCQTV